MIYNFLPGTGEFTYKSQKNGGVPLSVDKPYLPNTTKIAPPKKSPNKIAVFDGQKWDVFDDFRGVVYWNLKGEKFIVTKIGEKVPAKMTTVAPKGSNINKDIVEFVNEAIKLQKTPPGIVEYYLGKVPPIGFLACDGTFVSKTKYADLFAVIGGGYGEKGELFFIPDLRGDFLRGWDNGRGVDDRRNLGSFQDESVGSKGLEEFMEIRTPYALGYKHMNVFAPKRDTHPSYGDNANNDYRRDLRSSKIGETRPRNTALLLCVKY